MNAKCAALLATAAAGALLFVAACGGGGGDGGDGQANPTSTPTPGGDGQANATPGGGSGSEPPLPPAATCQTTIVGGDLAVAEDAPVGVTLLSTGGLSQYAFGLIYDNVFGIATSNSHDKWGDAGPFPPGTPIGTSTQVQLHRDLGQVMEGTVPSGTFPKGVPVQLHLRIHDGNPAGPTNDSSTASIGKALIGGNWHTASVTYGANNTATVTFFASTGGPAFSVSLTNVSGSGSRTGC